MTVLVDPPEGWKYGFPAPLEDDYEQQLRNAGYPHESLALALKYSRYIFDSEEDFEEYTRKRHDE